MRDSILTDIPAQFRCPIIIFIGYFLITFPMIGVLFGMWLSYLQWHVGTVLICLLVILAWQLWRNYAVFRELYYQFTDALQKYEERKHLDYLGRMAGGISHQMTQPIGIIRAVTSSALTDMEDGYFEPHEIQPLLEKIFAQTDYMDAMIKQFRQFASGDRNAWEVVDIQQIVENVVSIFKNQYAIHGVSLKMELSSQAIPIMANKLQLEEVLINLLTNAYDAVCEQTHGNIIVKAWQESDSGGYMVVDNGAGLAPDYRTNIFMPFTSTKSAERGTGLGLYTAQQIIHHFDGDINYQDNPNGGAIFKVSLPICKGGHLHGMES